jgi:hypothetical protein
MKKKSRLKIVFLKTIVDIVANSLGVVLFDDAMVKQHLTEDYGVTVIWRQVCCVSYLT